MELWMEEGDAWALLARQLKERFALERLPAVARTAEGKPWFPQYPQLHFNLSHSRGLALCGAGECPLGVDVERVRPRREGLPGMCSRGWNLPGSSARARIGGAFAPCGP